MHRFLFWGSLFVFILAIGGMIHRANLVRDMERDTDSYLVLASRSVDAAEINGYLVKYREGLHAHGLTQGSSALIFKMPYEDLAEHLNVVNQLITQSALLVEVDRTSDSYALQLGVLSTKIGGIPALATVVVIRDYLWLHGVILAVAFVSSLVVLVCYLVALGEDDMDLSDLSLRPRDWRIRKVA